MGPFITLFEDVFDFVFRSRYEAGGPALNTGASLIPVAPSNGRHAKGEIAFRHSQLYQGHHLTLQDVKDNVVTNKDIF